MILHDPILVPQHLTFDFESLCNQSFVTFFKNEDQGDGICRYTITTHSYSRIEFVFNNLNTLGEYQREYDHYNSMIRNYVWKYRVDVFKRYSILVVTYLILLFL